MNHLFRLSLVALIPLCLGGCFAINPISKSGNNGQYGEAVKIFESQHSYDNVSTPAMQHVCTSYLNLRDYKAYFDCSDHFREKVDIVGDWLGWEGREALPAESRQGQFHNYHSYLIAIYKLQAQALMDIGRFDEALTYSKECLRLAESRDFGVVYPLKFAPILGMVANAYALKGDRENAKLNLKKLNEINTDNLGPWRQQYVRQKAIASIKVAMALHDYDKALAVMENNDSEGLQLTASDLGSLTAIGILGGIMAIANPALVPTLFQAGSGVAYGTVQGHVDSQSYELAIYHFWKAKCLFEAGRIDEARTAYDGLAKDFNLANYASLYPAIMHDRGRIALHDGDAALAEKDYSAAIEALESYRSTLTDDTSKIGFVNDKLAVYGDMVALLLKQQRYDEAFSYAERGKSRALVDMLASRQNFKAESGQGNRLVAELDQGEQDLATASTPETYAQQRGLYVSRKQDLKTQAPEIASLVSVSAPDVVKLQALIPAGETLVEYYGSSNRLFAFVVTRNGIGATELDAKGLANDVTYFRTALTDPKSNGYTTEGHTLYKRLIAPLENNFVGKKLIVVPHGPLHYLPFCALMHGKRFMLDEYAIRLLPSASVMEFLKDRSNRPDSLLAFGNPDLNDAALSLPGAQREVQTIAKEMPGAVVLLRDKATKQMFRQHGAQYKYLHFATHGTFNPDKPLESGLFLAGNSPAEGLLTVDELYDIPLDADLVTLSACETGLGKVSNGDDVVGLNRGFLFAGASTIVSSLWEVDDKATALLMDDMYTKLKKTDKLDALRGAQLKIKTKYKRHPYYWAAFQLTGNE